MCLHSYESPDLENLRFKVSELPLKREEITGWYFTKIYFNEDLPQNRSVCLSAPKFTPGTPYYIYNGTEWKTVVVGTSEDEEVQKIFAQKITEAMGLVYQDLKFLSLIQKTRKNDQKSA
jgi:hypothetical protein